MAEELFTVSLTEQELKCLTGLAALIKPMNDIDSFRRFIEKHAANYDMDADSAPLYVAEATALYDIIATIRGKLKKALPETA